MSRRWLAWLRRHWLVCGVVAAFLGFLVFRRGELYQIARTLLEGRLQWVLVAVLLQVVCFVLYALLYHYGFHTVEVESRWGQLIPVLFTSHFLEAMVPAGGVSSLAVFIDDAARRGQSSARAAQGALLVLAADLATMTPLLAYGLYYLSARGVLEPYQAVGVACFLLFVTGLAVMLLLGRWRPCFLCESLTAVQRLINAVAEWLRRPAPLADDWAERNAAEFVGAARGIASHPQRVGRTLALALVIHLVDVVGLYAIFLAYGQPVGLGAVVVGFVMDVVFSVVSFIPRGIGIAEGVIALALTSLGVPMASAVVVALAARGLNIWLPALLGFLFVRQVRAFGARSRQGHE